MISKLVVNETYEESKKAKYDVEETISNLMKVWNTKCDLYVHTYTLTSQWDSSVLNAAKNLNEDCFKEEIWMISEHMKNYL